jgi:hypothetical protein
MITCFIEIFAVLDDFSTQRTHADILFWIVAFRNDQYRLRATEFGGVRN